MIRLLFIVPYPELEQIVKRVLDNHPQHQELSADIKVIRVEDTPPRLTKGYDAVIARGYSARKAAAAYANVPTIGLSISGYDIIRAVQECKERFHPKRVALCGLFGQMYETEDIFRLLGIQGEVFSAMGHEELPGIMDQVLASGCDAVIGGYSAVTLARQRGLPAVVIRTGEVPVLQSVNEAIRTVEQLRREQITSQMYKTVIYSAKDGICFVDAAGVIRVRNRVIQEMNRGISLMGRPLKEALPYLYPTFCSVLQAQQPSEGKILMIPGTKTTVSVQCSPVIATGSISGAVFHLTDITMIQELEGQIRRKLSGRGLKARYTFDDIIHRSEIIRQTIKAAKRYAASDSNVIIIGETGTGKELFAQSIHNASRRKNGPFVAINCAALPENLLESELFGHVEGAFTGAVRGGKLGLFEQAHGGTLLLDEITEISPSTQSKLLRVLQERQVRRIGDDKVIDVDARIISCTNRSISNLLSQGKFRRDLMYRLDILRLFLPPLRDREGDVELLFCHLLGSLCRQWDIEMPRIDPEALLLLNQYRFDGNIRELRSIVERVLSLSDGGCVTQRAMGEALYPRDVEPGPEEALLSAAALPRPGADEPRRIRQALAECGGSRTGAALLLGIDRSTLWRRMRKYGIT